LGAQRFKAVKCEPYSTRFSKKKQELFFLFWIFLFLMRLSAGRRMVFVKNTGKGDALSYSSLTDIAGVDKLPEMGYSGEEE